MRFSLDMSTIVNSRTGPRSSSQQGFSRAAELFSSRPLSFKVRL